jgi:hypothetical protein
MGLVWFTRAHELIGSAYYRLQITCAYANQAHVPAGIDRVDSFLYITQFFSSFYTKVIAVLIWNNLFFCKKIKIKIFRFSLKVGCVRYMHVKGF